MFKVTAFKDGKRVEQAIIEDPKEIKTLNMIEAMSDASRTLRDAGIEYDELRCSLVRVRADIAKLNELYLAPNDPDLAALEKKHEAFA